MSPTMEQTLAELTARRDIHDVLVRYCRAADQCDTAQMGACFYDDAWDDHGFFSGPASEFVAQAGESLRNRFVWTKHFMTNEWVELDGDTARSETSVLAWMRKSEDGALYDVMLAARYMDRFERRDGVWKIAHRTMVTDNSRVDRLEREDPFLSQGLRGSRGPDDPFYTVFMSGPSGSAEPWPSADDNIRNRERMS